MSKFPAERLNRGWSSAACWAVAIATVLPGSFTMSLTAQEPAVTAPAARLPIPGEAEQREATKFVRDLFADEFAAAKKPLEKNTLANSLLKQANDPTNSSVNQFVLYQLARDLAVSAPAVELACQIIVEQGKKFAIDDDAEIAAVLDKVAASDAPANVQVEAIGQATSRAEIAVREEKFDHALRLLRGALTAARKTREPEVLKEIIERGRKVTAQSKEFTGPNWGEKRWPHRPMIQPRIWPSVATCG
ncbi:hypothetical protein ETAA8_02890 [Anatilimnocola aggregata]|uniref:Uncharacterized protein n=1 Tax=Anatilimnocola aggregata TaxID=2528021 RepID=A0A517Y4V1_9BACT|nr:hypothetical protein [Anatilimnocola aggregata]QDU25226.1 hypothetical protein ETAA8_02890 [Anatilimnocola aggregata]